MSAALQETTVTYEELAELEGEFEDAETDTIRDQARRTLPLYEKRHALTSKIPNFWPLVIEQAPPDIDEYIQPSDSALLLSHLTNLTVTRFELDDPDGDPRSVAIRLEFSKNDVFEDKVLEKKFWHRRAKDGWAGLVSEPVNIRWKKGKDLTNGLLSLVRKIWEEEQKLEGDTNGMKESEDRKILSKKIQTTGLGGMSFFAWFGYIGRRISAEESRAAVEWEREKKRLRAQGKEVPPDEDEEAEEDEDEEDDFEIFQDGDELAICVAEDLWPGAIKYFTQAQENDALSDDDFESDDEPEGGDGSPPSKRAKK